MIEPDDPAGEKRRSLLSALGRGWLKRCPRCARGRLFDSYLKVRSQCATCDLAFHHHRADDAPPYFTIMIVGHVVVGGMLWLETAQHPPVWLHMTLWLPLTLLLTLALLPTVKGALIGLQWALRMHGFDSPDSDD
jgi:uncharacterized protein (DUF983 family)